MATINTKTYSQDKVEANKVTLAGPSHTVSDKQTLSLARVAPKPSGTNPGVARSEGKFTRSAVTNVTTGAKADIILAAASSVPVGAAVATLDDVIADFRSWVASADFVNHVKNGKILVS